MSLPAPRERVIAAIAVKRIVTAQALDDLGGLGPADCVVAVRAVQRVRDPVERHRKFRTGALDPVLCRVVDDDRRFLRGVDIGAGIGDGQRSVLVDDDLAVARTDRCGLYGQFQPVVNRVIGQNRDLGGRVL